MKSEVLVIEDNVDLAENIAELLREERIEVVCCSTSERLESLLDGCSFDVALVDINLGNHVSGLDLLPRLRLHSALSEVILMTSNASLHTAMQALRDGAYAYLPKPFAPEELVALTKRALAQVALKRERQALAQRLAVSEAVYRSVVETVEACILGIDAHGVVSFANRFASDRLGVGGALEGQSLLGLSDARAKRELAQALHKVVSGESVRDLETRHERADRTHTMRWTLTPLHGESLDVARRASAVNLKLPQSVMLAVGIDITDRIELERQGAESQAMAAMGTLATSLAHEIRNPLNAAKLQLELLTRRAKRARDEPLQDQLTEPAKLVRTELERLSTLLDEFLHLARPRLPVRKPCLVSELFKAVITLEEPLASSAGLTLRAELAEARLSARCDSDKLKQVLINLVRNSIDAMTQRGHGEIRLYAERPAQGGVIMAVFDDGPGLAPEMRETNAFEAFATTKPAGTGLGLSIVQKIVSQHDGYVAVSDRPEGGVVARLWISD